APPSRRAAVPVRSETEHPSLGPLELVADGSPDVLFCDNETNNERLFGCPSASATPKDGLKHRVVHGAPTVAAGRGTKAAFWYRVEVDAGEVATFRVRLRPPA